MRKTVLYLKDILAALDSIQAFTAGFDIAAFQEDDKTLSAVIRKFEIGLLTLLSNISAYEFVSGNCIG